MARISKMMEIMFENRDGSFYLVFIMNWFSSIYMQRWYDRSGLVFKQGEGKWKSENP